MSQPLKIPFFDYRRLFTDRHDELLKIIDEVSSRGAFIMQKELKEFELELAQFTGSPFTVGVGNATDGLELAWLAFGLKPGDEVIISAHTMVATASAIVTAGGRPIPVDIGEDNLIDANAIEGAITSRTVGISPTHLNGRTCNMERILQIANQNNLVVIEDSAQALGSKFDDKHAGTFGLSGSFSFYPAKVLGGIGDGGAVITNSRDHFEALYQLHDHGRDEDGEVKRWGRNSRLDNVNAALLLYKLHSYGSVIKRRRQIAQMYQDRLGQVEPLRLPPSPNSNPRQFDVYQNYELEAESRDQLQVYLASEGIGTLVQWGGKAIHHFKNLGFNEALPRTDEFFRKCIMLPMNAFISDSDVDLISEKIIEFYTRHFKRGLN